MLAFVATDAPIAPLCSATSPQKCRRIIQSCDDRRRHVDHDSFVMMASAQARCGRSSARTTASRVVRAALVNCRRAFAAIVRDGEGATKFITITVEGDATLPSATGWPARSLIRHWSRPRFSHRTQTWVASSVPSAMRHSRPRSRGVSFWLDEVLVVADGGRAGSYREEDGQRVMAKPEISVRVSLGRGKAAAPSGRAIFAWVREHQRGLSKLKLKAPVSTAIPCKRSWRAPSRARTPRIAAAAPLPEPNWKARAFRWRSGASAATCTR